MSENLPVTTVNQMAMPSTSPEHVGQATAIEQSRAAAEVQSAMVVAQRFPRDERHSLGRIKATCERFSLAQQAFYSYPRGGQTVQGGSIHLARELARCWGNIQYEIVELSQDTQRGESEVMAYAWDLETNVRSAIRFIIPHFRHTRNGSQRLKDTRDIYELIANNGSRRLRQCIFSVIPSDVVAEAENICRRTLMNGDGKPLDERIKACISAFEKVGVTRDMMKDHIGKDPLKMDVDDLTDMQIIYRSIEDGQPAGNFFDTEPKLKKTEKPSEAKKESVKAKKEEKSEEKQAVEQEEEQQEEQQQEQEQSKDTPADDGDLF